MTKKCPNCLIELNANLLLKGRFDCEECGFNYYPNQKKINSIYVWLSVDKTTDCEGMIAIHQKQNNTHMIACSSDYELCLKMEPQLRAVAINMGMKIKLVRYDRADVKKEIT